MKFKENRKFKTNGFDIMSIFIGSAVEK